MRGVGLHVSIQTVNVIVIVFVVFGRRTQCVAGQVSVSDTYKHDTSAVYTSVNLLNFHYLFIFTLPIYYLVHFVYTNFTRSLHSLIINTPFILIIIFSCGLYIYRLLLLFVYIFYVLLFTLTHLILLILRNLLIFCIIYYIHIYVLTVSLNGFYLDLCHTVYG